MGEPNVTSFQAKLTEKYIAWRLEIAALGKDELIARADEIALIPQICRSLYYSSFSPEQEQAILKYEFPLQEAYSICHAHFPEAARGIMVREIDKLLDPARIERSQKEISREKLLDKPSYIFSYKAQNAFDLLANTAADKAKYSYPVKVLGIVELDKMDFPIFRDNLDIAYSFIEGWGSALKDNLVGGHHSKDCILVKQEKENTGILVCSEGYSYARYAAYVPDCSVLDLEGLSPEKHEMPQRYRSSYYKSIGLSSQTMNRKGSER